MTADDRVSGLAKGAFPTFPRSQRVRLPTGVEGRDVRPFGVEEESTTEVQLGDGEPPTPPDQAAPLPPRPASPSRPGRRSQRI